MPDQHPFQESNLIGITVDRYAKNRLLQEASKDVQHYLVGYRLPPEIQNAIKQKMETSIVRHDWEQKFDLQKAGGGIVNIKVDLSYRVVSYSSAAAEFRPKLDIDDVQKPIFHYCEWIGPHGEHAYYKDDKLEIKSDRKGVHRVEFPALLIKPRKDDGGESWTFRWSYSITVPQDSYDVITFWTPVIDPGILAEYPDDFEFLVFADIPTTINTERRWSFEGLRAAGQHIQVKWKPRNQKAKMLNVKAE